MTVQGKFSGNYSPIGHESRHRGFTLVPCEIWRRLPQGKFVWVACLLLLMPIILVRILNAGVPVNSVTEHVSDVATTTVHKTEVNKERGMDVSSSVSGGAPTRPEPPSNVTDLIDFAVGGCNIWKGDWIPNPSGPSYSNATCWFIQEHQNCLKNGRPDLGFLYWKWKPNDCDLPLFDAKDYLKIVSGKSWAFIGDSIARNHFQSFLCSLAQVEMPESIHHDENDRNVKWYFRSYNFTLSTIWAPFLVQGTEDEADGYAKGIEKLHLDNVDQSWASSLHDYDYIVLSSGQWYLKTSVYFVKNELIGCHYCPALNLTEIGFYDPYRMALRTVYDYIIFSKYKGVVFFRTFTPDHFEEGRWDNGGECTRTVPFDSKTTTLGGVTAEMYKIQLQEFAKTVWRSSEYKFKLKIADTIHASLLRPDAHPGPYRFFQPFAHDKNARVQNDCLHWCLPGAIDTWSAMILEVLRHL